MSCKLNMGIYVSLTMAPDGTGGGTADKSESHGEPAKKETPRNEELDNALKEIETLKAEREKERRERLTDEERKAEESKAFEDEKNSLRAEYRKVQLAKIGLGEEYLPLVSGQSQDEIGESGKLLSALISSVKANTEKSVKEALSFTGTPAGGVFVNRFFNKMIVWKLYRSSFSRVRLYPCGFIIFCKSL